MHNQHGKGSRKTEVLKTIALKKYYVCVWGWGGDSFKKLLGTPRIVKKEEEEEERISFLLSTAWEIQKLGDIPQIFIEQFQTSSL